MRLNKFVVKKKKCEKRVILEWQWTFWGYPQWLRSGKWNEKRCNEILCEICPHSVEGLQESFYFLLHIFALFSVEQSMNTCKYWIMTVSYQQSPITYINKMWKQHLKGDEKKQNIWFHEVPFLLQRHFTYGKILLGQDLTFRAWLKTSHF